MEDKLIEAINKGKKLGRQEVVEAINGHPSLLEGDLGSTARMKPLSECAWWQAKLKEWDLEEQDGTNKTQI